jgi:hypothetical protein
LHWQRFYRKPLHKGNLSNVPIFHIVGCQNV